jgi:hypothetical protein
MTTNSSTNGSTATSALQPDLAEIRRAVNILFHPGGVHELRALETSSGTASGYYDNCDKLIFDAYRCSASTYYDGRGFKAGFRAKGVYLVGNPVKHQLLARSANELKLYVKKGDLTTDDDIDHRRWLFLDFDPKRVSGISSTDAEKALALERARAVQSYLLDRHWPPGILADSGNGFHLLYAINLPNDDASYQLIKSILAALGTRFSDEAVEIDASTVNASRLIKLHGSVSRKGSDMADRPWRVSRLLEVPQ